MSGDRESMVVCRHEDGALEIVSQGTETQLISRDLLVEVVASLNQNLAEIKRLRSERDAERALANRLAHELNDFIEYGDHGSLRRAKEALAVHKEARHG